MEAKGGGPRGMVAMALVLACWCVSMVAAHSPKALKGAGVGHRMTSLYEFDDGTGFVANLELIQRTEIYGPDISPLQMIVRYTNNLLNLMHAVLLLLWSFVTNVVSPVFHMGKLRTWIHGGLGSGLSPVLKLRWNQLLNDCETAC